MARDYLGLQPLRSVGETTEEKVSDEWKEKMMRTLFVLLLLGDPDRNGG